MNQDGQQQPEPVAQPKRNDFPYSSPLYPITQIIAVVLMINVILPAVLNVSWTGTNMELALFYMLYAFAFWIATFLFLAVAGYFAIMMIVAQSLRKLTMSDVSNKNVAKALAIRVLLGNQPRWLISLTPCVVPAITLAFLSMFYQDKLHFETNIDLLEASLLQGLISFVMCLPFILKTQKVYGTDILARTEEIGKE